MKVHRWEDVKARWERRYLLGKAAHFRQHIKRPRRSDCDRHCGALFALCEPGSLSLSNSSEGLTNHERAARICESMAYAWT